MNKNFDIKWKEYFNNINEYDFIIMDMFPYPSGQLHLGHIRNYVISDILFRYNTMTNDKKIYRPFGWDSFGLPAENAAIQFKMHPQTWTSDNISKMKKQILDAGIVFNWENEINTSKKSYYTLNQKIFKIFFEKGLIYKKLAWLNWDNEEETVLANEQVIDGKGWRSGKPVIKKLMSQWFFKAKIFAEELEQDLDKLSKWPIKIIKMQENWIGRHEGFSIKLNIFDKKTNKIVKKIECFSKTPDILIDAQCCCLSLNHELSIEFFQKNDIYELEESFFRTVNPKTCYWHTNFFATSDIFEQSIDVFITNKVNDKFGFGSLLLTPNFSEKDKEICLEINFNFQEKKYTSENESIDDLKVENKTLFKLEDWCISRQRVWGCPIPIIFCENCGTICQISQEINDKKLNCLSFKELKQLDLKDVCKKCNKTAICEIDTLDTFFDSSWYYIRYIDMLEKNNENQILINKKNLNKLLPIEIYIGGAEHATLHLLYSRIFLKALYKIGIIDQDIIPFKKLINQGMILSKTFKDANGKYIDSEEAEKLNIKNFKIEKMSKSKFNSISPNKIIEQFNPDTLRLSVISDYPIDKNIIWDNQRTITAYKHTNFFKKLILKIIQNNDLLIFVKNLIEVQEDKKYINITDIYKILKDDCSGNNIFLSDKISVINDNFEKQELNKVIAELFTIVNWFNKNIDSLSLEIKSIFLIIFIIFAYPIIPFTFEENFKNTCLNKIYTLRIRK